MTKEIRKSKGPSARRRYINNYWQLYAMMALPLAHFLLFKYLPMFGNILAFRRFRPLTGPYGVSWVGFRYFEMFLNDAGFLRAFSNTLILSVSNLVINFPIPIIFAILLNELRNLRFKRLVQTVSYMPRFISTVVVISILTELLSPSSGLLNRMLQQSFGLDPVYYMNDAAYFRPLYVLTDMWQYTGWSAIIYLAAITNINAELFEAARIDGASRWQQIRFVTLPTIMPTVMVMFILKVGHLLSLGFEKVLLMYTPANSPVSDIIDTYVYRMGFQSSANQYSYATAIGLFSGLIGLILVASSNYLSRRATGESIY
ncbi:MAG: ABC transporter permease subunit [Eubacteriales bacterium]|jgi:putative aldouronate transport system permease protein|nr:ABC transporter permease subunit [Eubacteriales bacterium]MDD4105019.1 ABC transporter permease subunit [Eubacteriales bacterium]MDD4710619.1 ABC transporter permease subunit [Eubacteriales bacterium]NLO14510.1 sugar ABC transporter permease [Clostridiales bacterium]